MTRIRRRQRRASTSRLRIDHDAVERAANELGLQSDVRVLVRHYKYGSGRYIGSRDGVHHIGLHADLSPGEASMVIWHELTHALQAERLGGYDGFVARWSAEMKAAGLSAQQAARAEGRLYNRTALEREAIRNETRHNGLHLTAAVAPLSRLFIKGSGSRKRPRY